MKYRHFGGLVSSNLSYRKSFEMFWKWCVQVDQVERVEIEGDGN